MSEVADVVAIDAIQYPGHREPNWYARIRAADGRVWHGEPWMSRWAAEKHADILWERYAQDRRLHAGAPDRRAAPRHAMLVGAEEGEA